jgi:hypothetical protein
VQPPGQPKAVGKIAGDFTFREIYWIYGSSSERALSVRGFKDEPFIAPRWWLRPGSPYGESPGMDALPDIMQLQQETLRKGELLEKHVRPPLNAPAELKNQPSSILPGRVNYTNDTTKGMRPVFEVDPQALPGITADLQELQQRIQKGFFNDLFLMLSQATKDMTAYEVAQRQQEKLQVLGPVIERFNNEAASPAIKRVFNVMMRKRLIPPMPQSLMNVPIQIEYVSMLALAQRAVSTAGIERLLGVTGNMVAIYPQVRDLIDPDEIVREYGDQLGVSQKVFRSKEDVEQIRKQAAAQQAQQAKQAALNHMATEVAPNLADAAQNLSQTSVGGGLNALQMMMGQQGGALQ